MTLLELFITYFRNIVGLWSETALVNLKQMTKNLESQADDRNILEHSPAPCLQYLNHIIRIHRREHNDIIHSMPILRIKSSKFVCCQNGLDRLSPCASPPTEMDCYGKRRAIGLSRSIYCRNVKTNT